jgi:hypothetical protein
MYCKEKKYGVSKKLAFIWRQLSHVRQAGWVAEAYTCFLASVPEGIDTGSGLPRRPQLLNAH